MRPARSTVYCFTESDLASILDDLDVSLDASRLQESREEVEAALKDQECEIVERACDVLREMLEELEEQTQRAIRKVRVLVRETFEDRERDIAEDALVAFLELLEVRRERERYV